MNKCDDLLSLIDEIIFVCVSGCDKLSANVRFNSFVEWLVSLSKMEARRRTLAALLIAGVSMLLALSARITSAKKSPDGT